MTSPRELLRLAAERGATNLAGSSLQGEEHWKAVAWIAMLIAYGTAGSDPVFGLTFAVLHDVMRENDGEDPGHGERAARLFDALCENPGIDGFPPCSARARALSYALRHHSTPARSEHRNLSVGICWDADRLNLMRLGITPRPEFLSTPIAHNDKVHAMARQTCLKQLQGEPLPRWDQFVSGIAEVFGQDVINLDQMRRQEGAICYHGTSATHRSEILREGIAPTPDEYAGGHASWVTPNRDIAMHFASWAILRELDTAGRLDEIGIIGAPNALIVKLRLAGCEVEPRLLPGDEWYVPGGLSADTIVSCQEFDLRHEFRQTPIRLLRHQVQQWTNDGAWRERDESDAAARWLESHYGTDAPTALLQTTKGIGAGLLRLGFVR